MLMKQNITATDEEESAYDKYASRNFVYEETAANQRFNDFFKCFDIIIPKEPDLDKLIISPNETPEYVKSLEPPLSSVARAVNPEHRTLINPFRPEEFIVRITANRRRWIHVFPVDRLGRAKLAHHYVVGKSTVHVLQTTEPVRIRFLLEFLNLDKVISLGLGTCIDSYFILGDSVRKNEGVEKDYKIELKKIFFVVLF